MGNQQSVKSESKPLQNQSLVPSSIRSSRKPRVPKDPRTIGNIFTEHSGEFDSQTFLFEFVQAPTGLHRMNKKNGRGRKKGKI